MKIIFIVLLSIASATSFGQQKKTIKTSPRKINTTRTQPTPEDMAPRQTVTDKYLNGPTRNNKTSNQTTQQSNNNSPFVGGVHPVEDGKKRYDSVNLANPNAVNNRTTTNATVAGGNDTTFNVNTINQGGVTTNSGAVDRSGQSQFGQTNWGNSRQTIGESQWTVPPPITASFSREFPTISNATWSRNNVDTSLYSARYQSGASWVTSNYNNMGQRVDTRTEIALLQPPRPVSVFIAKQPQGFQPTSISLIQMQGRPEMYEVRTNGGKTIYINSEGMEVNR